MPKRVTTKPKTGKEISPQQVLEVQKDNSSLTKVSEHRIDIAQASYEGPIPPPEVFKKYGEVVHDAPERILKVFEDDSKHHRDFQMQALWAHKNENKRAQWMAYTLIFFSLALAYLFSKDGKDMLAATMLSFTALGVGSSFLKHIKNTNKKNEDE